MAKASLKEKPEGIFLPFDNRFARLPSIFYTKMEPEKFAKAPYLIHGNPEAARLIDLDPKAFLRPDFPAYFSGNKNLPGAEPLAQVYAGHQFGGYVPQLGDGRALLLGQVRNKKGELWDVQLKGAGLTPYSRASDGRAVLRSSIREYLCSEAMHALGIPTTRALCIISTGEIVAREKMEPGAIITRLSPSHIRFGHFEYFYHTRQHAAVMQLADHVIAEHFKDLSGKPGRHLLWFEEIVRRTARLMAQWQAVGFAHGVMNTDNLSVLGLTIDYGPFGFVENYNPGFVCNHSDELGRYAFDRQPAIAHWNLSRLAEALQPLFPADAAKEILAQFSPVFQKAYNHMMCRKLGVKEDNNLWQGLLSLMQNHRQDYTLTFRSLSDLPEEEWLAPFKGDSKVKAWYTSWRERADIKGLQAMNPKYILRNWVAESAIRAAEDRQDYTVLDEALKMLQSPYTEQPDMNHFARPAPEKMCDLSVSCSS